MAPKKPPSLSSPIPIGNCEVTIQAKKISCQTNHNTLQISLSKNSQILISVAEKVNEKDVNDTRKCNLEEKGDCCFLVVNPKVEGNETKSLLQEALNIYKKELPAMNFAANTGKKSTFLERCVSNGKYCTLLLRLSSEQGSGEVISAITYQIIPADSLYAEVPLAAVSPIYQYKGIGHLMYMELRKRLQSVGVYTIYCWGDKESEGFWHKQGFQPVGVVDTKGRARRLPIRADVRKALCFPGGATLMVSHLNKDFSAQPTESLNRCIPLKLIKKSSLPAIAELHELRGIAEARDPPNRLDSPTSSRFVRNEPNELILGCRDIVPVEKVDCINMGTGVGHQTEADVDGKLCSCSAPSAKKRRVWEASCTSLKSKKVKGGHLSSCKSDSRDCLVDGSSLATSTNKSLINVAPEGLLSHTCSEKNKEDNAINLALQDHNNEECLSRRKYFKIMLMNIADDAKQCHLTKIIEELGGAVTIEGSLSTHVITGKVRKTLNFCIALCSGAWVISANWLKESYREGRFVDESPFILKDEEYELKYRTELKTAVFRAKADPWGLFKGYDIFVAAHVQPPATTLSKIAMSAGGNVIDSINEVNEASKTIYVASEVETEEALVAVKKGIWTFSSDWFMNCIMKQELDFEAPQFIESL